jgi:hypothetical protein
MALAPLMRTSTSPPASSQRRGLLPVGLSTLLYWPSAPLRSEGGGDERGANQGKHSSRQARIMATKEQPPTCKRQKGEELDVEHKAAEEVEPITTLTDLPATMLMRIHELIIGGEVVGAKRCRSGWQPGPSNHHIVGIARCRLACNLHAGRSSPPPMHAQAAQWRMTCRATRASATMPEELEVPKGLHGSGGARRTWAPIHSILRLGAC